MEEKIFLITAGHGPLECCRAVYRIKELIINQASKLKLEVEVVEEIIAERTNTLHSCILKLKGCVPEFMLREWRGTVQWTAQSPYRPLHKRKNWFVGIELLESRTALSWSESEVTFQTFRASGPGGQNVNKVESAVRIKHEASGIEIQVMDSRSQLENKKIALRRLAEKIEAFQNEQALQLKQNTWTEHLTVERGNPVKVIRQVL